MHDVYWYGFDSNKSLLDLVYEATHNAKTEYVWLLHESVDYTEFDLRFVPDRYQRAMLHAWPAHNNKAAFTTWLIPIAALLSKGYTGLEKVFHDEVLLPSGPVPTSGSGWHWELDPRIDYSDFDLEWFPDFWDWDMNHAFAMKGTTHLAYTFMKGSTSKPTKYHLSDLTFDNLVLVDRKISDVLSEFAGADQFIWITDSRIDYAGFDFDWLPDDWDKDKLHYFVIKGKSQLGYTAIVNPAHYDKSSSPIYHKSSLKLSNHTEFVTLEMIGDVETMGRKQRYFGNMEDALRTAIRKATKEWLWVVSDCCDYSNFDFSWLPDLDQRDHVHCWPSGSCEKGETFLINTIHYEDGRDFKFNFDHEPVKRKTWPIVNYYGDSLAEVIAAKPSKSLYTVYVHGSESFDAIPEPCLWKDRPVIGMNQSNSVSLVPRDCVAKREIYEYPFLEKRPGMATDSRMDVIFISNGEPQAIENHTRLLDLCHDARSVNGINGRLNSYKAAAHISSTDWFIAVFAKCWMREEFQTFEWYPDYWQEPKHYIFLNHNENNGLVYGHMAPIAYNTRLMLENKGGLDMTLAQAHAVVPVEISCTWLEGDPWLAWRTAFREVIKLLHYSNETPTIESQHRLWTWENQAIGMDAEWLLRGARDARAYYERCGGELAWLIMSNEWDWCRKYFLDLYSAEATVSIT